MTDNEHKPLHLALQEIELFLMSKNKQHQNNSFMSTNAVTVICLVITSVCLLITFFCSSSAFVNHSRVIDLQREVDTLKNRVDINEAYISNLSKDK